MQIIKPYKKNLDSKTTQVEYMFDSIAKSYDRLNGILSLNIDKSWRKKLIKQIQKQAPQYILDIATGTGDLAIGIAKMLPNSKITGIDISSKMLDIAKKKSKGLLTFKKENAEHLSFPSNSFDAVTATFGIRNFEHLGKGLQEIYRVLKKGGKFYVLEFGQPQNMFFKTIFDLYGLLFIKTIAKVLARKKNAYSYLVTSSKYFPCGREMEKIFFQNGFKKVVYQPISFGICYLYMVEK